MTNGPQLAIENAEEDLLAAAAPPPPTEPPDPPATSPPAPDPFDLDSLRLDPAFEETAGVRKILSVVPVRKPSDQEWFRVCPDIKFRGNFSCIKLKDENEFFLLTPAMAASFDHETMPVTIYTCVSTSGVVFLWPCRIASSDGRQSTWHTSAHEAAAAAMVNRIRIRANRSLGAYEFFTSNSPTAAVDPVWPTEPFTNLVQLGFVKVGRYVANPQHPVIKQLTGD